MGMTIHGIDPRSNTGHDFDGNDRFWKPMVELINELCPEIAERCASWHTHDGKGLGARDSWALACALERAIKDGGIAAYLREQEEHLNGLPDMPCAACGHANQNADEIPEPACKSCNGSGRTRPFETRSVLSRDDLNGFIAFLASCGGFTIR